MTNHLNFVFAATLIPNGGLPRTLVIQKEEAVAEAKQCIDRLLYA